MIRSLFLVWCVASFAACSVGFDTPDGATITCVGSSRCPDGMVCAAAVLQCIPDTHDTTGPRLLAAEAPDVATVRLTFDEAIAPGGALDPASYAFTPALAISALVIDDSNQAVTLTVNGQRAGATYAVRFSAVTDYIGNLATSDGVSFIGSGITPDRVAPVPLAPKEGDITALTDVLFAWTARSGATEYTVTIATDDALLEQIPGSPFKVTGTTMVLPALPGVVTYHWSVAADVTQGGAPLVGFDAGDGIFRVFCGDDENCGADPARPETGNLTRPFRSVARAVSALALRGVSTIRIAPRESSAYDEVVQVSTSVDLSGKWNRAFDAQVESGTTVVSSSTTTPLRIGFTTNATAIHDLTVRTDGPAPAIVVQGAEASLLIQHNIFTAGPSLKSATVVFEGAGSVEFSNNEVHAGGGQQALLVSDSQPRVYNNVIEATQPCSMCACLDGAPCERSAVKVRFGGALDMQSNMVSADGAAGTQGVDVTDSGKATIVGNTISARNTASADTMTSPVHAILVRSSGVVSLTGNRLFALARVGSPSIGVKASTASVIAINNVIHAERTSGIDECSALSFTGDSPGEVLNNTLLAGSGTGIVALTGNISQCVFANNLIGNPKSGSTNVTGFHQLGSIKPASFVNNVIFHVQKGYAISNAEVDIASLDEMNADGARFQNNQLFTGTQLAVATVFADIGGPDGNTSTFSDNDYHLKLDAATAELKNAGLDLTSTTGRSSCYDWGSSGNFPPTMCSAVLFDIDLQARSNPLSPGAYEKN